MGGCRAKYAALAYPLATARCCCGSAAATKISKREKENHLLEPSEGDEGDKKKAATTLRQPPRARRARLPADEPRAEKSATPLKDNRRLRGRVAAACIGRSQQSCQRVGLWGCPHIGTKHLGQTYWEA